MHDPASVLALSIQRANDGATAEYILVGSLLSVLIGLAGGVALDYVVTG